MFEQKLPIFQDKNSILCPEILSEGAGQQWEVSTWKLFLHAELQEKWTLKFLVDAGF
jgi:hypothetical protein